MDALPPARVDVMEVIVENGSQCVGRKMSEIPFPRECVIASVRRGGQVFIPRGTTIVEAGDTLVMVSQGTAREQALRLCRRTT